MHILVLLQPQLPNQKIIDDFVKWFCRKKYRNKYSPEWQHIRPREIRLYDFQIPEEIEKEVLADLLAFDNGGHRLKAITERLKLLWPIKLLLKKLGIEEIDRTIKPASLSKDIDYPEKGWVYLHILGKLKDTHKGKLEML